MKEQLLTEIHKITQTTDCSVFKSSDSQEEVSSTTFLSLHVLFLAVKIEKESSISQKLKPMSFVMLLPKYDNQRNGNYGALDCI